MAKFPKLGRNNAKTTNFEKHTTKNPVGKLFLKNFLKTVVSTLRPLQISSVLDVGCGEGFTLARLQKEKIGKTYQGIEADPLAIELGKKALSQNRYKGRRQPQSSGFFYKVFK